MRAVRAYVAGSQRLWPLDGGSPIIPPDGGPGGGDGPSPGARDGILMGVCPTSLSGSDFPAKDASYGPLTIRRSYQPAAPGMPVSWAASNGGVDVGRRASAWSGKPNIGAVANGSLDGQILRFLRSIPQAHPAFVSIWHEPDGKIKEGLFSLSVYKQAFARFCSLTQQVKAEGWPHLHTFQCVTTWSGTNPSPGTTYADMWPGDGLVDCYGLDGYAHVGDGPTLWGPGVDFARSKGIPWCIPEIGYGNQGTQDVAWMERQVDYMTSTSSGGRPRAAFACWFDVPGPISTPTPGNNPEWIAAARAASQEWFTDYTAFVL